MYIRYLLIGLILVFAICTVDLSAQTARTFRYQGGNGGTGYSREAVNVTITETAAGYVVSGEYVTGDTTCTIKGVYTPTGRGLTGTCRYERSDTVLDVKGFKLSDKDAIQISVNLSTVVAYRDGKKPCTMAGLWKQETKGIAATDWNISANGTARESGGGNADGKATLSGNKLRIEWSTGSGYKGYYEWTLDEQCNSNDGKLQFNTPRTDSFKSTVRKAGTTN